MGRRVWGAMLIASLGWGTGGVATRAAFDEGIDPSVMQRLGGLVPGAYSRLGAAIRHGAAVLSDRGGTSRRLLVVLSDGLAYDHGYEPAYGVALRTGETWVDSTARWR